MASVAQPVPAQVPALKVAPWPLLAVILLAVAALAIGWVGFVFSDDASYYRGASEWVAKPPFAGDDHWTTRFPLVLSLAGAILLLGDGSNALALTSALWYLGFVVAGTMLARRIAGEQAGWIAAALIATMPLIATAGSVVNCDLPEALFLVGGIVLLADAKTGLRACLAGLCFGAAILCRETAILGMAALGPLFLAGRPFPRRILLAAGLGCLGLLAAEMLFQWAMTGEPLHRYLLAFHHDTSVNRADNLEGNLLVNPLVDPILVLLINNEFGLLFPLALYAVWAGAGRGLAPDRSRALLLLGAMAVSAFVAVATLGDKLVLNPRYFTLAALAATVAVALWLVRIPPRWRLPIVAAMIGSNLLLLSAQNQHPQWPAEALVLAAQEFPSRRIVTDGATLRRAELPLAWEELANVGRIGEEKGLLLLPDTGPLAGPEPLRRYASPATPLGALLIRLNVDDLLPGAARTRLVSPSQPMLLLSPEPPIG
ncbi:MAG TPA: glycosyltransferase family 39 protein [Allosphingosinicella sp.]|jgi:4-amino-4-deoxy-L-arabinose transferase-like glycosyltransferase